MSDVRDAMRVVDPAAEVVAYQDDTYLLGTPDAVLVGMDAFSRAMAALGLRLREHKTQVWSPEPLLMGRYPVLDRFRVPVLKCVGAVATYASGVRAGTTDGERDHEVALQEGYGGWGGEEFAERHKVLRVCPHMRSPAG